MDHYEEGDDLPPGWQIIEGRPFCGLNEHGSAVQVALKKRNFVVEVDGDDHRHRHLRAHGPGDVSAFLDSICK